MRARGFILAISLSALLGGCGALTALDEASQPLEVFELTTPEVAPAAQRSGVEIVVEEPIATGALTTDRIMIRPSRLQAQYLPGVRWSDEAPTMVQTLMVRALTETGAAGSVGRRPLGAAGDFAILSELTDFQAETTDGADGARVTIRLIVRIVRERDARVASTRIFEVRENAASTEPGDVIGSFDRAMSRVLNEIAPWVLSQTGAA